MKNRIIALILAFALVLSFASCDLLLKSDNAKGDNTPDKNDDLTVEIETVEYSEAEIAEANDKVERLVSDLAYVLGYGKYFDEERREALRDTVAIKLVPVLIDVGVYPEEFIFLVDAAQKGVTLYSGTSEDEINPKEASDLYTEFISIIDIDRLGALIYEIIMIRLDGLYEGALEKYESKNSKLNLDNLEYYTALLERAKGLGRAKFTDAFSVITFSASLFNGTASVSPDGIQLSADDAFAIIKKQGERFAEISLEVSDWQAIAAVTEEFLPDSGSTVKEKLLLSLNYADFFIEAADIMPDFINLFAEVTRNIKNENIELVKNGGEYAYELLVVRELISSEELLRELLVNMKAKIPAPDTGCVTAVKSYDKAGYLAFTESYDATADDLIDALKAFSLSATKENYEAMTDAYLGYLASVNSVVTYVYIYS